MLWLCFVRYIWELLRKSWCLPPLSSHYPEAISYDYTIVQRQVSFEDIFFDIRAAGLIQ